VQCFADGVGRQDPQWGREAEQVTGELVGGGAADGDEGGGGPVGLVAAAVGWDEPAGFVQGQRQAEWWCRGDSCSAACGRRVRRRPVDRPARPGFRSGARR